MNDKNKVNQSVKRPSQVQGEYQVQGEGEKDDKFKPTFPIPKDPEVVDPQAVTKDRQTPIDQDNY